MMNLVTYNIPCLLKVKYLLLYNLSKLNLSVSYKVYLHVCNSLCSTALWSSLTSSSSSSSPVQFLFQLLLQLLLFLLSHTTATTILLLLLLFGCPLLSRGGWLTFSHMSQLLQELCILFIGFGQLLTKGEGFQCVLSVISVAFCRHDRYVERETRDTEREGAREWERRGTEK